MRAELEQKLIEKYPALFEGRHQGIQNNLMGFGCECGDGWYGLLDTSLGVISRINRVRQEEYERTKAEPLVIRLIMFWLTIKRAIRAAYYKHLKPHKPEPIILTQVKEKYGELRIYTNYTTDELQAVISFVEDYSLRVCEVCGDPGQPNYLDENGEYIPEFAGWIRTRCKDHEEVA
jgi:hypothetical protein